MPTALITDTSRGSAISIMRSLGRQGWRVIAADHHERSIGFRSRYATQQFVYPCPATRSDEMLLGLVEVATNERVDLLVPVTDDVLLPMARSRHLFPDRCHLAIADADALCAVTDKHATLQIAQRAGVPVPRSVLVRNVAEALHHADRLGWPLVVKPCTSVVTGTGKPSEHFSVSYARNARELAASLPRGFGPAGVLLQEYCGGDGYGVEMLTHEGRPLAAFQHRRVHEVPITGGASALRESAPLDPELYRHAAALLRELRWTGLAMVEFKAGADGPRLMEINGRIWGSLPLAVRAGMDFPARLADLYLNGPPPPGPVDTTYRVGVRSRNLRLELVWIGSVLRPRRAYPFLDAPSRRSGLTAAARLALPRDGYDNLCRDDPRPGLAEIGGAAAHIVRKVADAAR